MAADGPNGNTAGSAAPILRVRNLSKTFGARRVLSSLDLDLARGEVHALLGENGSGKSTFIKVLSGLHLPDPGGHAELDGRNIEFGHPGAIHTMGGRFVHQDLGLIHSESILDNLAFGNGYPCRLGTVRRRTAYRKAVEDLDRVGLDLDPRRPVTGLSPAQRSGVAIARALQPSESSPTRLLILDEPTAALPASEVERLLQILRSVASAGVSVLYVTHRLDEVFEVAENLTVLRDGEKVATRAVEGLTRSELVTLLVGEELEEAWSNTPPASQSDRVLLSVRNLQGSGLTGISFSVGSGEILGVAGITGSGSDSLMGAVFGSLPLDGGEISVAGVSVRAGSPLDALAAGMAYLPRDRKTHGAAMTLSASENLTIADLSPLWRRGRLSPKREATECHSWFERLDVRPRSGIHLPLGSFSGGNQQKVLFGRCLRLNPKVFLLDQPTQGVDVGAKAELHRQLRELAANGSAVVVASSDIEELEALCRRVLVIRHGGITSELVDAQVNAHNISRAVLGEEEGTIAA